MLAKTMFNKIVLLIKKYPCWLKSTYVQNVYVKSANIKSFYVKSVYVKCVYVKSVVESLSPETPFFSYAKRRFSKNLSLG